MFIVVPVVTASLASRKPALSSWTTAPTPRRRHARPDLRPSQCAGGWLRLVLHCLQPDPWATLPSFCKGAGCEPVGNHNRSWYQVYQRMQNAKQYTEFDLIEKWVGNDVAPAAAIHGKVIGWREDYQHDSACQCPGYTCNALGQLSKPGCIGIERLDHFLKSRSSLVTVILGAYSCALQAPVLTRQYQSSRGYGASVASSDSSGPADRCSRLVRRGPSRPALLQLHARYRQRVPFSGSRWSCKRLRCSALVEASHSNVWSLQQYDRLEPIGCELMAKLGKGVGLKMWPADGLSGRLHEAALA